MCLQIKPKKLRTFVFQMVQEFYQLYAQVKNKPYLSKPLIAQFFFDRSTFLKLPFKTNGYKKGINLRLTQYPWSNVICGKECDEIFPKTRKTMENQENWQLKYSNVASDGACSQNDAASLEYHSFCYIAHTHAHYSLLSRSLFSHTILCISRRGICYPDLSLSQNFSKPDQSFYCCAYRSRVLTARRISIQQTAYTPSYTYPYCPLAKCCRCKGLQ